jgi:phenylalanyl-tRNA synthetase beta chain
MKIPLSWLRDYVPISLPVPELIERLSLAGLEVAGVHLVGVPAPEGLHVRACGEGPVWHRDRIFVAQIQKVEKHPDADRLKLPTVEYGPGKVLTMVTGAPNISVGDKGQKVILALTGSVLYDGHAKPGEKVLKELKPGKIRGVMSEGMCCSELELGLSEEHEGIIILEDDAPVGTPLADFMGDVVLEIDMLPNMARCLSMIGVARETAALTGQALKLPAHAMQEAGDPIKGQVSVRIEDPKLSARYACSLLKGVKIGPAPRWLQRRLQNAGMRPISNVVDITNYVMLEWGQPLHAFDYDLLKKRAGGKAPTIIVRSAKEGEKLKTLDGQDRTLTADMLVIADTAGPIALAGVMGGGETEVTATTSNVLIESANFDFISIRRTMRALNLPSEASHRFSRGVHPELVKPALERASELMREHAGATLCKGIVDSYPAPIKPQVVELKLSEVKRILGIDIPKADCARLLKALEFTVEEAGKDTLRVTVPPHRLDIQEGPADLIEELARLYGYDKLPATLIADRLPEQANNEPLRFEERVRDLMVNLGLQEVITYALTTPEAEKPLTGQAGEYVELLNPVSSERTVLRRRVLPGVLEVAQRNLENVKDVRLFEIGSVYLPREGQLLPDEPRRVAVVLSGQRQTVSRSDSGTSPGALDFYDLKGVLEALTEALHLPEVKWERGTDSALHPARSAVLVIGKETAGQMGELHPRVAEALKLGGKAVLIAELDLEVLQRASPARHRYQPISRFPAALRDIAIVVDEDVTAERIAAEIRAGGGELLHSATLFDLYRGESIGAGKKSLAYALSYQAADHTLKDDEVDEAHTKIEKRLRHVLRAQIRGEDTPK